jgi:hypothetical protein
MLGARLEEVEQDRGAVRREQGAIDVVDDGERVVRDEPINAIADVEHMETPRGIRLLPFDPEELGPIDRRVDRVDAVEVNRGDQPVEPRAVGVHGEQGAGCHGRIIARTPVARRFARHDRETAVRQEGDQRDVATQRQRPGTRPIAVGNRDRLQAALVRHDRELSAVWRPVDSIDLPIIGGQRSLLVSLDPPHDDRR